MSVRSKTIVPFAAPAPAALGNGVPGTNGVPLNIPNIPQVQEFWCWAACTLMVLRHNNGPAAPATVCRIVNKAFDLTSCCNFGNSFECNCTLPLPGDVVPVGSPPQTHPGVDLVSVYHQHQINPTVVPRSLTFDELKQELRDGRPVEICLALDGGGGHVVLATGWHEEAVGAPQFVHVNDPQFEKPGGGADGFVLFSEFAKAGQHGKWTATLTGL